MRVDFYVLGSSRPEPVVAALAARIRGEGQRLLVVEADEAQRTALSRALWDSRPELFLANGLAGDPHAECQPILISEASDPLNLATLVCLADGRWREAEGFERVLYLVDDAALPEARKQWKRLGERTGVERHFWKQDAQGRWSEGP